ncbi:MAG: aminotransferase class I/II-fold pyridoxal phosphate-dependent enzyme, partial [Syntrophobacteraceae bacterium]|nr:aminotransferase class I/II-fold pyridoxal phosphate-dependent enzyme [Syntrophobacteraceae bacterium]
MKILAVKLKNINTLLGEWEIRFDRPPLSDTGLFAIVGPNGSGKSSILDALTLALYGETSRLRSPESSMLTWPSEEASSEVTFSVGDTTYRSRWSVRKSGGIWDAPEMWLSGIQNGDETLLEDRMIRVRSRIAEFTKREDACVYSSGYVTNVAIITGLTGPGDLVLMDKLDHASIVDGCLMSGSKWKTYRHNDM